jgi:hypothetical protein
MKHKLRSFVSGLAILATQACVLDVRAENSMAVSPNDDFVMIGSQKSKVFQGGCGDDDPLVGRFQSAWADHKQPGNLSKCIATLTFSVPVAYGDNFFGGVFELTEGTNTTMVAICFDDNVGHFYSRRVTSMKNHQLILLVVDNCTSG